MQLLRDNLTLWTSSDGGEAEPAPPAEAPKETGEKAAETVPAEAAAAATEAPAEASAAAKE
jgi:14-3-3 protein epsilon